MIIAVSVSQWKKLIEATKSQNAISKLEKELGLDLNKEENRLKDKSTKIYLCKNYVCDLPIDNMDDLKDMVKLLKGVYKSK